MGMLAQLRAFDTRVVPPRVRLPAWSGVDGDVLAGSPAGRLLASLPRYDAAELEDAARLARPGSSPWDARVLATVQHGLLDRPPFAVTRRWRLAVAGVAAVAAIAAAIPLLVLDVALDLGAAGTIMVVVVVVPLTQAATVGATSAALRRRLRDGLRTNVALGWGDAVDDEPLAWLDANLAVLDDVATQAGAPVDEQQAA